MGDLPFSRPENIGPQKTDAKKTRNDTGIIQDFLQGRVNLARFYGFVNGRAGRNAFKNNNNELKLSKKSFQKQIEANKIRRRDRLLFLFEFQRRGVHRDQKMDRSL